MRRALMIVFVGGYLGGTSLLAGSAQARRSHCARSGDYCLGMFKRGGQVFLGFDTFRFRGSVRLCVTSPDGKRRCHVFRLRPAAGTRGLYRSHVRWRAHFPHGQAGRYRAVWSYGGARLPSVTFTVPLADRLRT